MAEVERKNGTDKKHSLSSFDKRKVQLTEFEGQHSKKYKISDTASGNTISPEKTQRMKTAAFMQYQNKEKNPGAASTSAREEAYTGRTQHTSNYSSNYSSKAAEHSYGQSEKSSVAERKTMSPEMADRMRKSAYIQQMNNKKSETAVNSSLRQEAYSGQFQHTYTSEKATEHTSNYSSNYSSKVAEHSYGQSEKSSVADIKTMSPEMADRMRKAAFIQQMNKEKVKAETAAAAYTYSESKSVDVPERNYYSGSEIKTAEEQTKHSDKSYSEYSDRKSAEHKGEAVEERKVISPEMAQRMKRAAYIQQQNNEKLEQNIAEAKSKENDDEEEDKVEKDKSDDNNNNTDGFEKLDIITGAIKGSDSVGGAVPAAVTALAVSAAKKKAKELLFRDIYNRNHKKSDKEADLQGKKNKSDAEPESSGTENKNETASDITKSDNKSDKSELVDKSDNAKLKDKSELKDKADKSDLKDKSDKKKKTKEVNNKSKLEKIVDSAASAKRISDIVQSSDSVGAAVPDVITTLAVNEAKKRAAKALKTNIFKKKDKVKHKFIDSLKDRNKVLHRLSPRGLVPKGLSREERKNYLHNVRVSDKLKSFYSQRLKKAQRNKQKEIFLKTNPIDFFLGKRFDISNYIKKKGMTALIAGGGGTAAILPIFIIIIVVLIISIMFAWVQPPKATLIGANSKADEYKEKYSEEGVNIKLNAELINNYFDMAEATYMYEFKEWYGGVYSWSDLFVSFTEWAGKRLDEAIAKIRAEVQKLFEKELAEAKTPEEYVEVQKRMGDEINKRVTKYIDEVLKPEYEKYLEEINDEYTISVSHQPYETNLAYVRNNKKDSKEINGKPVAGLNQFGNVKIQTSLSSEELVGLIAVWKEYKVLNCNKASPTSQEEFLITPQDIMKFMDDSEFITYTAVIKKKCSCSGQCIRKTTGTKVTFMCPGNHEMLTGQVNPCKTKEEMLQFIVKNINENKREDAAELTLTEVTELYDDYIEFIQKEITDKKGHIEYSHHGENVQKFFNAMISDDPEAMKILKDNYWEIPIEFTYEDENGEIKKEEEKEEEKKEEEKKENNSEDESKKERRGS